MRILFIEYNIQYVLLLIKLLKYCDFIITNYLLPILTITDNVFVFKLIFKTIFTRVDVHKNRYLHCASYLQYSSSLY